MLSPRVVLSAMRSLLASAIAVFLLEGVGNRASGGPLGDIPEVSGAIPPAVPPIGGDVDLLLGGDANEDTYVNLADFNFVKLNFGRGTIPGHATDPFLAGPAVWRQGDFDFNRKVDLLDFVILRENFGRHLAVQFVPEPSAWTLFAWGLALGGALAQRVRRDCETARLGRRVAAAAPGWATAGGL